MEQTIKDIVESILKEYPITRDDDFLLCLRVLIRGGFAHALPEGKVQIDLTKLQYAPAFETITRVRREIQNEEHRFQASEEVQQRRILNEIKQHSKYSNPTKNMNLGNYPSQLW